MLDPTKYRDNDLHMMGAGDNKTAKRDELEAMLDKLEKAERDPASLLRNDDGKSDMSMAIEMSLGMIEPKLRIEHPEKYEEYKVLPLTARLSYVVNLYPDLAKRCDPSLVQRFDDLIGPLLEKVLDSSFARAISSQSHPSITSLGQNLSLSGTLIIRSVYETRASDKERTLLFLNHYKTAVEGLFKWQIDLTTYALVKSGILFVRGSKQLRMQTLGQVKKEDLGHKLNFVRNHGLDLLSSACNPTLRNGIAHESYEVAENGAIRYWDRRMCHYSMTQDELVSTIQRLNAVCGAFNQSWLDNTNRIVKERIRTVMKEI